MKKMSTEDCKTLLAQGTVELIDIREPWEVAICSIGGTAIPMHEITEKVAELSAQKAYVIVCKTGRRAEAVANLLESEFHFSDVAILEGGITEWFAQTQPSYEMY